MGLRGKSVTKAVPCFVCIRLGGHTNMLKVLSWENAGNMFKWCFSCKGTLLSASTSDMGITKINLYEYISLKRS